MKLNRILLEVTKDEIIKKTFVGKDFIIPDNREEGEILGTGHIYISLKVMNVEHKERFTSSGVALTYEFTLLYKELYYYDDGSTKNLYLDVGRMSAQDSNIGGLMREALDEFFRNKLFYYFGIRCRIILVPMSSIK